ncbi:MAG: hypothetical protein K0S33_1636 [Bacteroidetes bacterium]|jgi:hypothetical protein|nr:hypothetical protein [Bacteroidota bacterium]
MSANNENSVQERVFPHSIVSLRSNGIIHVVFRDLITIGYKESKEINDAIGKLGKGKRMRVLMESAINTNFEKEAREFSAGEEGQRYTLADAFIATSTAQSIFVNFYLKINRPPNPSKCFSDMDSAVQWLLSIK